MFSKIFTFFIDLQILDPVETGGHFLNQIYEVESERHPGLTKNLCREKALTCLREALPCGTKAGRTFYRISALASSLIGIHLRWLSFGSPNQPPSGDLKTGLPPYPLLQLADP